MNFKIVIVGVLFLLASLLMVSLIFIGSDKGLAVSPSPVDFGTIAEGKHEGSFTLRNETRGKIKIEDIKKSCTCGDLVIDDYELDRGEETNFSFTWDLAGRSGDVTDTFLIDYRSLSNNRTNVAVVTLVSDVIPDFKVEPETLSINVGGSKTATLKITPVNVKDVKILGAYCTLPQFTVEETNDNEVTVAFSGDPQDVGGSRTEPLLIVNTSSKNRPQVKVPLRVRMN